MPKMLNRLFPPRVGTLPASGQPGELVSLTTDEDTYQWDQLESKWKSLQQRGVSGGGITVTDGGDISVDSSVIRSSDARLTDSRSPSGAAGGDLSGTYPNPAIAAGAVVAADINASLKPSGSAAAGTEALRALGTSGSTAAAGNDSRLSDARTPLSHSHGKNDLPAAIGYEDEANTWSQLQTYSVSPIVPTPSGSDRATPRQYVDDAKISAATMFEAPGMIKMFGGLTVPTGFLFCNGAANPISSFPNLASAITRTLSATASSGSATITVADSTQWPVGASVARQSPATGSSVYTVQSRPTATTVTLSQNVTAADAGTANWVVAPYGLLLTFVDTTGTLNFRVPDLVGRMTLGYDPTQVTSSGAQALGQKGGQEKVFLTASTIPAHTHDDGTLAAASAGDHSHGMSSQTNTATTGSGARAVGTGSATTTGTAGAHTHDVTGSTGSTGLGNSHENMPPYQTVNFIIKT